jgi:hypothetical protein
MRLGKREAAGYVADAEADERADAAPPWQAPAAGPVTAGSVTAGSVTAGPVTAVPEGTGPGTLMPQAMQRAAEPGRAAAVS